MWDVEAAVKAGLRCIAVEAGGYSREELIEAGAHVVYRDRKSSGDASTNGWSELVQSSRDIRRVLHVACDPDAMAQAPLVDTDEDRWEQRCEAIVFDALQRAQEAFSSFAGGSGRIVFVMPSVSLLGAAGLVPLTAALKGVRALAKSAARQWAEQGITVNCVVGDIERRDEIAAVVDVSPATSEVRSPVRPSSSTVGP